MSAAKANNNKDTYKATAITLIVFGVLTGTLTGLVLRVIMPMLDKIREL